MPTIYSISSLANSYADKKMVGRDENERPSVRTQARNRIIYNFTATGFNISTIVSVAAIAAAVIINSPLTLILALLVCGVRQAFKEGAERASLPRDEHHHLIIGTPLADLTDQITGHLGIDDENWTPVKVQLLNFRIWMSTTPAPAPAAVAAASNVSAARMERGQSNRNNNNNQIFEEELVINNNNNNNRNFIIPDEAYSESYTNSNNNYPSSQLSTSSSRG